MSKVTGPATSAFGRVTTESDRQGREYTGDPPAMERGEYLRRQLVGRLPSGLEQPTLGEWEAWCAELASCMARDLLTWDEATRQTPVAVTMTVRARNAGAGSKLKSLLPKVTEDARGWWSSERVAEKVIADAIPGARKSLDTPDTELCGVGFGPELEITTADGDTWPCRWEHLLERGKQGVRQLFVNGHPAGELHGDSDWRPQPPSTAWARPCLPCQGTGTDPNGNDPDDPCPGCAGYGIRGRFDGLGAFTPERRDPPSPIRTTTVELGQMSAEDLGKVMGMLGEPADAEVAALAALEKMIPPEDAGDVVVRGVRSSHLRWMVARIKALGANGRTLLEQNSQLERRLSTHADLLRQQAQHTRQALDELGKVGLERNRLEQQLAARGTLSEELASDAPEAWLRATVLDLVSHQGETAEQAIRIAVKAWNAMPAPGQPWPGVKGGE